MTTAAHALLAVDVITMAVVDGSLCARLVEVREGAFAGEWAFPGSLVSANESLEEVAWRELAVGANSGAHLEQLGTFGDPRRDPDARIVATAYLALISDAGLVVDAGRYRRSEWFDCRRFPTLAYDHAAMASAAIERLRAKLGYTNIVRALLPRAFTLSQLQGGRTRVILDRDLDRRNFRKKLLATGMLEALGRKRGGAHRPAELYRFASQDLVTVDIL